MSNPFTGILLNGEYYNYQTGSYNRNIPLRNESTEVQNSRTFSLAGKGFPVHTMTLSLDNIYYTFDPATNAQSSGTTTNLGISRLVSLVNLLGGVGGSQPLTFVAPDGSTHLVVPTGSVDATMFPEVPNSTGVEYRVSLTLVNSA